MEGIFKQDHKAFIFSANKQRLYPVTDADNAVYCLKTRGPCFGGIRLYGDYIKGEGSSTIAGGFSQFHYYSTENVSDRDSELMGAP